MDLGQHISPLGDVDSKSFGARLEMGAWVIDPRQMIRIVQIVDLSV